MDTGWPQGVVNKIPKNIPYSLRLLLSIGKLRGFFVVSHIPHTARSPRLVTASLSITLFPAALDSIAGPNGPPHQTKRGGEGQFGGDSQLYTPPPRSP